MRQAALVAAILSAALVLSGCWGNSTGYAFKGDVIGKTTLDQVLQKYKRDTVDRYGAKRTIPVVEMVGDMKACAIVGEFERPESRTLTAAGLPIEQMAYGFSDDILVRIYGTVRGPGAESLIKRAFTEKYGPPTKTDEARRMLTWENGVSQLEVYGVDSWATFALSHKKLYLERNTVTKTAEVKKLADDL